MAFETLLFARDESFAVITFNRPPANAISVELVRDLNAALNSVESETRSARSSSPGRATGSSAPAPTSARPSRAMTSRRSSGSATA
jgi:hypothetical protein